jgi:hypothetical protein
MKIEIGKYYLNRLGQLRMIESEDEDELRPFNDQCCDGYTKEGHFFSDKRYSEYDLVKEVRVTIEEIETVSEFEELKKFIAMMRRASVAMNGYHHETLTNEVERLQKLFEGSEK